MKKILLFLIIFLCGSVVLADVSQTEISSESNALSNKEVKAQLQKIKTKRIIIANALRLTDAQKEKANKIYSKNFEKEALLLAQLKKEQSILKEMSNKKRYSPERKAQRKIVYELEKAIINIEDDMDKEFRKILTREQKSKFNRFKREITISDF